MGTTKKLNRKAKSDQKDFEARKELMMAELKASSKKYTIDLMPVIQVETQGIFPLIAFVDRKGEKPPAEPPKPESKPKLEV